MTAENGGSVYAGIVAYTPVKEVYRSYITIPFLNGKREISLSKGCNIVFNLMFPLPNLKICL